MSPLSFTIHGNEAGKPDKHIAKGVIRRAPPTRDNQRWLDRLAARPTCADGALPTPLRASTLFVSQSVSSSTLLAAHPTLTRADFGPGARCHETQISSRILKPRILATTPKGRPQLSTRPRPEVRVSG
jgi:hypothetical protein